MTRRRTVNNAEAGARRIFREYGFNVESVPFIRAQHEGEFMNVVVWPAKETAKVVEFFTRPENTTMEMTRIHVGHPGPDGNIAVRIYFRFDLPRTGERSQDEINAEWERIERALGGAR